MPKCLLQTEPNWPLVSNCLKLSLFRLKKEEFGNLTQIRNILMHLFGFSSVPSNICLGGCFVTVFAFMRIFSTFSSFQMVQQHLYIFERMHYHTGCVCLAFIYCACLNDSPNCLVAGRQSYMNRTNVGKTTLELLWQKIHFKSGLKKHLPRHCGEGAHQNRFLAVNIFSCLWWIRNIWVISSGTEAT